MMHPGTELRFISDEIGCGVFAKEPLPRGTITWCVDELDQHFTAADIARMHPLCRAAVERYSYVTGDGVSVLCWDHGRFVNHSCDPNCLSGGFDFEFAVRDIAADEELTDDYAIHNLAESMDCRCGSAKCRGQIDSLQLDAQSAIWDALVTDAALAIGRVPQPLWPLLREIEQLTAVLSGTAPVPPSSRHRLARVP